MISTGVDSWDLNIPYKTLGEILLRMFCRVEEGPTGSEQLRRHTSNLKGDWKAPWVGESWIPRWLHGLIPYKVAVVATQICFIFSLIWGR